jgi:hypothetical protein
LYTGYGVRAREALPFRRTRRMDMLDKIAARDEFDNPQQVTLITVTVKQ